MNFSKYFYEQHDLTDEVEKYEAFSEKREVVTKKCLHKNVGYKNGELRCPCGAAWMGPGLDRLARYLKT